MENNGKNGKSIFGGFRINIGTWNVHNKMGTKDNRDKLLTDMEKYNVDIACLQETCYFGEDFNNLYGNLTFMRKKPLLMKI